MSSADDILGRGLQRLIIEGSEVAAVQPMGSPPKNFGLKVDPRKKTFRIWKPNDWTWIAKFAYENPQPDLLTLKGEMDGHPVTATLRRFDEKFLLNSRGFHWITEIRG